MCCKWLSVTYIWGVILVNHTPSWYFCLGFLIPWEEQLNCIDFCVNGTASRQVKVGMLWCLHPVWLQRKIITECFTNPLWWMINLEENQFCIYKIATFVTYIFLFPLVLYKVFWLAVWGSNAGFARLQRNLCTVHWSCLSRELLFSRKVFMK